MSFPLFRRPGAIVFLDDDPDYLEMLAVVLPRQWHVELFMRPHACINYLQQEPPRWESDAWAQQQIIDHWREGTSLIPQILSYWATRPERYALTQVCVFDYSMPGMDGLQALGELVEWPGSRILLTGQADEQVAISAFNRGLIDQFIAKQTPDISHRLIDAVQHLLEAPHARHAQIWRATLTPQQNALLRVPSISRDLSDFAAKRWVEHVVLGDPFGVLGMDAKGNVSWLQLETTEGLDELATLAESQNLVPQAALQDVRQGRRLIDLELQQALGHTAANMNPAFSIGLEQTLLAALFPVSPNDTDPQLATHSYAAWLAQHAARTVRD